MLPSESDTVYDQSSLQNDPFQDVYDASEPQMSKLDCTIFAEPLTNWDTLKDHPADLRQSPITTEISTNDDPVTVTKINGKRKKYNIQVDPSNPICPLETCKKTFSTVSLLKAHIRKVHCSTRDFVCEMCGARFTAQYLLNRHFSVHGTDRTQCPVCKKMLSKRTNLSLHLRSHADTRVHACATCGKRFLRKSTLRVHLNFVHKGNADD